MQSVPGGLTDMKFKMEQLKAQSQEKIADNSGVLELHLGGWITGFKLQKTL